MRLPGENQRRSERLACARLEMLRLRLPAFLTAKPSARSIPRHPHRLLRPWKHTLLAREHPISRWVANQMVRCSLCRCSCHLRFVAIAVVSDNASRLGVSRLRLLIIYSPPSLSSLQSRLGIFFFQLYSRSFIGAFPLFPLLYPASESRKMHSKFGDRVAFVYIFLLNRENEPLLIPNLQQLC